MSEDQEELEKKAIELDKQIHELEKQKMEITKSIVKDKIGYKDFKDKIEKVLKASKTPLTWTHIKEKAGFTQKVPYNKYVLQMEKDIGLKRIKNEETKQILWSV